MSIAAENRETCLKVTDLKMYFPVKSGIFSKARSLKAVDRGVLLHRPGRDHGSGGGVGLRQDHRGADDFKALRGHGGSIVYKGRTSPVLTTRRCGRTGERCR